ncbi:GntR family transcriptional regulator [Thalassospira profundimaris]|uniref:GntR family transcriptional regulator n=1 Tax=Thalassospira profundimaris TaxID=502049 RepID=UPI000DEDDFD7|nr:GntR family transcriptional regulator [Thalassospira profundimaris]
MPAPHTIPTVQHVCQTLTRAIHEGRLVPGQRLTELELSRKLSVSRPTIREAFRQLCVDGLLHSQPHRGVCVRHLTRQDVDEHFMIRANLEVLAVRLAAPILQQAPAPLLTLQDHLNKAEQDGNGADIAFYNHAFHQLFAKTSGNSLLQSILNRIASLIYGLQLKALIEDQQTGHLSSAHQDITSAILAGRNEDAARLMADHIDHSRQRIQWLDDSCFAPPQ